MRKINRTIIRITGNCQIKQLFILILPVFGIVDISYSISPSPTVCPAKPKEYRINVEGSWPDKMPIDKEFQFHTAENRGTKTRLLFSREKKTLLFILPGIGETLHLKENENYRIVYRFTRNIGGEKYSFEIYDKTRLLFLFSNLPPNIFFPKLTLSTESSPLCNTGNQKFEAITSYSTEKNTLSLFAGQKGRLEIEGRNYIIGQLISLKYQSEKSREGSNIRNHYWIALDK